MKAASTSGRFALMLEEASTSVTSVNVYQTTERKNPEDSHRHTRSCEKSHVYEPSGSIKGAKILNPLSKYQPLKNYTPL